MNIAAQNPSSPEKQAIENISKELNRLYQEAIGKDPDPEAVWAEAEEFVAKYGPNADLKELF